MRNCSGEMLFTDARQFGGSRYRRGANAAGLTSLARELRQRQTQAERLLWGLLRNRRFAGAKFRRQHQFGKYICDFYCAGAKLVVECDGVSHASPEAAAHDEKRDAYLRSLGLTVLRFENKQILSKIEKVLSEISKHLP